MEVAQKKSVNLVMQKSVPFLLIFLPPVFGFRNHQIQYQDFPGCTGAMDKNISLLNHKEQ
jgi:hypothetical protein